MKTSSALAAIFAAAAFGGAVAQAAATSATHAMKQSGEMSVGGATAAPESSASCSHLFQGGAHEVFTLLVHAHLRPAPLWPTYLPPSSRHAHWSVYGIRGAPLIRVHPRIPQQADPPRTA